MLVNEIFYSIQGEGVLLGLPTIFIRFTGCNLRCNYCDTKYSYNSGKELSISQIISKINNNEILEIAKAIIVKSK